MKVCIVGTGATGWMVANYLKTFNFVTEITIIGSSKIPTIGVGESTTLLFKDYINYLIDQKDFTLQEFFNGADAALKYGVFFQDWSKDNYIHYFKSSENWDSHFDFAYYHRNLGNKDKNTYIHDIIGKDLFQKTTKNEIFLDDKIYPHSYHFDASKFINFFTDISKKSKKIKHIDSIVIGGEKTKDKIKYIVLEDGEKITCDYFIFATGDSFINDKFLGLKYEDYGDFLLTDTALFAPLTYKDKRKEFHPYTVAKTMTSGWRWITPTWSRIGTGYVFSSDYISIDQAVDELKKDIGVKNFDPSVVKFKSHYTKKTFYDNWCVLGQAAGFLEPLDAPGLNLFLDILTYQLLYYLNTYNNYLTGENKSFRIKHELEKLNSLVTEDRYRFWAVYIFTQFKTCYRTDTKFWLDYKKINFEYYEKFISMLDTTISPPEISMLQFTLACKNIKWKSNLKLKPYPLKYPSIKSVHHLDYISSIRNL